MNSKKTAGCMMVALGFLFTASPVLAVNAPDVAISCVVPGPRGDQPCRYVQNFPNETVFFDVNVVGDPDYIVKQPERNGSGFVGGGYIELFVDGTKTNRIRIDDSNTPITRTEWVWFPIFNQYLPWQLGSPTKVRFSYTFPAGTGSVGTHAFNARFSGDDFTSPANSSVTSLTVSCAPYISPSTHVLVYPPAGSGCP